MEVLLPSWEFARFTDSGVRVRLYTLWNLKRSLPVGQAKMRPLQIEASCLYPNASRAYSVSCSRLSNLASDCIFCVCAMVSCCSTTLFSC